MFYISTIQPNPRPGAATGKDVQICGGWESRRPFANTTTTTTAGH
jgi:hypothetical protein